LLLFRLELARLTSIGYNILLFCAQICITQLKTLRSIKQRLLGPACEHKAFDRSN